MDRLTEVNKGIVVPKLTANCKSHEYHCEDCECTVMYCKFLRDALNLLCDYENTGLTPEDVPSALEMSKIYVALQKLKAYEQAEAEGRLIALPCAAGDEVWILDRDEDDGRPDDYYKCVFIAAINDYAIVSPFIMNSGDINDILQHQIDSFSSSLDIVPLEDCCFTREAAEAALAEAQQG